MISLGEDYLTSRGIELAFAMVHGIEIDQKPDPERIKKRLGGEIKPGDVPLSRAAKEIIWIPLRDAEGLNGEWMARPLPTIGGKKFLCGINARAPIYIPPAVYAISSKPDHPLIITEGPIKALAIVQAGFHAVGLNGVWCAADKDKDTGKVWLRTELKDGFDLRGRKVYVAFDADAATNPDVRHASIRLFVLLSNAGAEVYQLTSWDLDSGKGIDDFLVHESAGELASTPADTLRLLMKDAALFLETIKANKLDLDAVTSELRHVDLSPPFRAQFCKLLAPQLGLRTDDLRQCVAAVSQAEATDIEFNEDKPWDQTVEGSELFFDLCGLIHKHVVIDDQSLVATVLMIFLTYLTEQVDFLPVLGITSPEKRCGKTRLMTIISRLACRAIAASNISSAAVYRSIDRWKPTLILDEADTYMHGEKGEELRGVINSGSDRANAYVIRCDGEARVPRRFSTWAVRVIAKIGKLPGTIADRTIHIDLKRRATAEKVEPLRNTPVQLYEELRCRIVRWVADHAEEVATARPKMPESLGDRQSDAWFSLLSIAQPLEVEKTARKAMEALCSTGDDDTEWTTAVLIAIRKFFKEQKITNPGDLLPTEDILGALNDDQEAPWADSKDGMTAKKLSMLLRRFKIRSKRAPKSQGKFMGYRYGDFIDVFARYLHPEPEESEKGENQPEL